LRRLLVVLSLLLLLVAPAFAKLDGPQWTEAEKHFRLLFSRTGEPDSKIEIAKTIAGDGEPRSFKVITDGLLLQAGHVLKLSDKLSKDLSALQVLLGKKLSEMYPADRDECTGSRARSERSRPGAARRRRSSASSSSS
jgi:hypothetical protein